MNDQLLISAYGSHNASVAMYYKGQYHVVEVERWLNKKNAGLITYLPAGYPQVVFDEILDYLLGLTDRSHIDVYLTNYSDLKRLKPKYSYNIHANFDHHEAHAATAFYQSPYQDALTFTFDGGGDGGFFNVYRTSRNDGIQLIKKFNQDLGFPYMIIADHLQDIRRDSLNIGNLVYAGKIMGLCSYGTVRQEWVPAFHEFYETFNYTGNSYIGGAEAKVDALPKLMTALGVDEFDIRTRFEGQFAWDMAATSQYVFEEQFFKFAQPFFDEFPDLPVTLAGGCALNVLLNKRILDVRGEVFVPPNTNDCGIAVGGLLKYQNPAQQVDLTYAGIPLVDQHMLSSYVENGAYTMVEGVYERGLAEFIANGNIVGVINGNSEHGPRALGNRSILCNPVGKMKDILNKKVKDREWYRPFAPVTRLQDASKYFEFPDGAESRHMVYVAKVREEWREKLPAITHEDGTGRLQTVTKQQNEFLYNLISHFEEFAGHGVMLNTSFNVNGKPILSRLSDALEILNKTQLDAVYYNNCLIFRKFDEEKFTRSIVSENVLPLAKETTNYLLALNPNENFMKYKEMITRALSEDPKCVIITSENGGRELELEFPDETFWFIEEKHLYYHELMESVYEVPHEISAFDPYVRLLWIKPIMHKNYFRTRYHMFLSLDGYDSPASLARTINSFSKEDRANIFMLENGDTLSQDVVWGSLQDIEWLSVQFEGQLLHALNSKTGATPDDMLRILKNKFNDKIKVIADE
jgi:carbamoyltransferase